MTQGLLLPPDGYWQKVRRTDPRARVLADRHYSRQTVGAPEFMANGRTLVLLTHCASAVWGVIQNLDPVGNERFRCSIFRNESLTLSSVLIREATWRTYAFWVRRYHGLPGAPLTTEVDPDRTLRKRDPGRCFRRAGWSVRGVVRARGGARTVGASGTSDGGSMTVDGKYAGEILERLTLRDLVTLVACKAADHARTGEPIFTTSVEATAPGGPTIIAHVRIVKKRNRVNRVVKT